ncbi:techylectin-5A-like [Dermacentor albipictus]|uniref:techylectin-5A-like n=1 Tax=Dermacentor albipictus TaxID=60249 RepID=UPI0031FDFB9D
MGRYFAFLFVLVTASAVAVQSAALVKLTVEQVEEPGWELSRVLYDIKNTIEPRHCSDLLRAGQRNSGVYTIFHQAAGPSRQSVYCDMKTDGGGWTVIQRRGQFGNSAYHFYRNWTEYVNGFGDPAQEYWIGNNALHALTSGDEDMSLRVVLKNNTEYSVSADYESIHVGNEDDLYKLHLGKLVGPEVFFFPPWLGCHGGRQRSQLLHL